MTKDEIVNKIKEMIEDKESWLVLYYKGIQTGIIELNNTNGETEKNILDKFKIYSKDDEKFLMLIKNESGCCSYIFDYCRLKYLVR